MTREEAKQILGEGATEEQVSNLLNSYHISMKTKEEELKQAREIIQKYSDYDSIKTQLDEINKAKMTEQEQIAAAKKEAEKNLNESKIILNKAKAKEILSGFDIEEDLVNSLVSSDEDLTLKNANLLKTKMESFKDTITKQVQEQITKLDVIPGPSNVKQDSDEMTKEKFDKMSMTEQKQWKDANINKYHEFYPQK